MTNTCNILFTSCGRRVSLIRHFIKALRQLNLDGNIVAADASDRSPAFHITDRSYLVPRVNTAEYIPRLVDICSQEQIGIVIPLIDTELAVLAENRHRFGLIGTQVIVSDPEVIAIGMNKTETRAFFKRNGIDTPEIYTAQDIEQGRYHLPLMVKPNDGSASKMVFKAETHEQLTFFRRYVPHAIIQEFIDGDEYTLDVFVDLNGLVRCVVPRLRLEVRAGEVSKGLIVKNDRIIAAGKKVGECLSGTRGCITLQCIVTRQDAIKMIEINPRFGGGAPLSIEAGADMPKWVVQMVRGQLNEDVEHSYRDGLMMLRYDDEIFVQCQGPG
jgi:carbamoyl-phosphate synthase large subunit